MWFVVIPFAQIYSSNKTWQKLTRQRAGKRDFSTNKVIYYPLSDLRDLCLYLKTIINNFYINWLFFIKVGIKHFVIKVSLLFFYFGVFVSGALCKNKVEYKYKKKKTDRQLPECCKSKRVFTVNIVPSPHSSLLLFCPIQHRHHFLSRWVAQ